MYEVYIDGVLRKITRSIECVDYIIQKFIGNNVKNQTLTVELNGNIVYTVDNNF